MSLEHAQLLDSVLVLLLSVLVGLLGVALVVGWRWLRAQELGGWAAVAVQAAEQIWTETGSGEQKLNYAMDLLKELFPRLDDKVARALIETAVRELTGPAPKAIVVGDELDEEPDEKPGGSATAVGQAADVDPVELDPVCRYGFRIETHKGAL